MQDWCYRKGNVGLMGENVSSQHGGTQQLTTRMKIRLVPSVGKLGMSLFVFATILHLPSALSAPTDTVTLKYKNTTALDSKLVSKLRGKAELGDIEAQFQLGEYYTKKAEAAEETYIDPEDREKLSQFQETRKENLKLAFQWYLKAAEKGHAKAQYMVGKLSEKGFSSTVNHLSSFQWYLKAAEQGVADAQEAVGYYYAGGYGEVKADSSESFKWYLKAAKQGNPLAQLRVGEDYEHGRGTPIDIKETVNWYSKAAEGGYDAAQYALGCLLAQGSPNDYVQAFMWLEIVSSTDFGRDAGIACADNAAKMMTPKQREQSRELAREWKERHSKKE